MAMYRIKPAPNPAPAEPSGEYWRETSPEQARDLDFDEIEYLNQTSDGEEGAEDEPTPTRRLRHPWLRGILAALVILAFGGWVLVDIFAVPVDFSFLMRSAQLAKEQSLAELRDAVVVVECSGSSGSGFNIRDDGLIVTNQHVVDGGGLITVTFPQGDKRSFVARDSIPIEGVDLALIDIKGDDLPAVSISNSLPAAGEELIFIGNPLGFDWTISEGQVLGLAQADDIVALYLSGPIRSGSSGSPVFNSHAQVVAVIFATISGQENTGLAIPISYLTSFLEEE